MKDDTCHDNHGHGLGGHLKTGSISLSFTFAFASESYSTGLRIVRLLRNRHLAADESERMVEHNRRMAWYADRELRVHREAELQSEHAAILRNAVILAERRRIRRLTLRLLCGLGIALVLLVVYSYFFVSMPRGVFERRSPGDAMFRLFSFFAMPKDWKSPQP